MSDWRDNVSGDFLSILSSLGNGDTVSLQSPGYTINTDRESVVSYTEQESGYGCVQMRNGIEYDRDERLQGRLYHSVFYDTSLDVKPDWRFVVTGINGSIILNIEEVYQLGEGVTVREFRCTQVLNGTT